MSLSNWSYYKQSESAAVENEIPLDEILQGDHEVVYANWHFHQTHCAYMWRKMQRAVEAGGPVDGYINTYKHTRHCAGIMLLENIEPDHIGTKVGIKYPVCV